MRPVIEPENIYAHRHEEQDVILWYNRAVWHCIVSLISGTDWPTAVKGANKRNRLSFRRVMDRGLCISVILLRATIQLLLKIMLWLGGREMCGRICMSETRLGLHSKLCYISVHLKIAPFFFLSIFLLAQRASIPCSTASQSNHSPSS